MKYILGTDIGGTTVKTGLFSLDGLLLESAEFPTDTSDSGSKIINSVKTGVYELIEKSGISKDNILGLGVGVPGPVLRDGTVNRCVNLGWGVFNLQRELNLLTGFNVKVANDANLAALGEMWKGAAVGHDSFIMVTLGTGIGGGIIMDGKILPGCAGSAGEIGHITADHNEKEPCSCGKKGCLEQYASATGIKRLAKRILNENSADSILRNKEELSPVDIFSAAEAGDSVALNITDRFGKLLGRALADTANILNPELILLGGGMSAAGDALLIPVKKYFSENIFHACSGTEIALASLGGMAGIYGCAKLIAG